uniref:Uncharacterized protein n=1 Tax=Coturnix japonica TaxID=93934 RepID=A0A8C2SQE5_COTJA
MVPENRTSEAESLHLQAGNLRFRTTYILACIQMSFIPRADGVLEGYLIQSAAAVHSGRWWWGWRGHRRGICPKEQHFSSSLASS